jgi:hypothetical protein
MASITASVAPFNNRNLVDAQFVQTASVPTTLATTALNLGVAAPFPATQYVTYQVSSSAVSFGGTQLTASFITQDSADNVSFTNVSALGALNASTATSPLAAQALTYMLPPNVRQYVRVSGSFTSGSSGIANANLTGSYGNNLFF